MIRVSYEYSGMIDYWGGNGRRWDSDAGCLFVPFGTGTTLADIVDGLVDDYMQGGDCDEFPPEVSGEMIREAIMMTMLNEQDRVDVINGALVWCAEDCEEGDEDYESPAFVALVEIDVCPDCRCYVEDADEYNDGICDDCAYWTLCCDDDGQWFWTNEAGKQIGSFSTDDDAMANRPK